jgi:hypothetical protein
MKKIILVLFILLVSICSLSYADITVQWDANTEPDLAGYKVYYDEISQCPDGEDTCTNPNSLYTGTGAVEGSSPIIINETLSNPEFTLTGLDSSIDWFISVTAFDNETPALESDLSNQVVALKDIITPPDIILEETTLLWDANTEPDLAGYKVYYDTNTGTPYSGTGAIVWGVPADSPIIIPLTAPGFDPTNPEITLKLDGCITWFFVVTAYDTENLESDYSNEVSDPDGCPPEPPTGVIVVITPI